MPFCPKCGKEITSLIHIFEPCYAVLKETVEVSENGITCGYVEVEDFGDYDEHYFVCPLCGSELFDDWDDAEAFLMGDLEAHLKALGKVDNGE